LRYVTAFLAAATLILSVWALLILTIKVIEIVVLALPSSLIRSVAGIMLYALWGVTIILIVKTSLRMVSARIAARPP